MAATDSGKDPLFGNKLAAAILIVLLLAVGLPVVVNTFSELAKHVAHHEEEAPYPGGLVYAPFDFASIGTAGGEEEGPAFDLGTVFLTASVEQGARAAAICSSCHSFDRGGPHGTGPNLWEIVGRPVAAIPGYAYSGALRDLGGEWTYEKLNAYLENSQGYVPGTQMAQKIRKDDKRVNILAYLGSLSDSPVPYPDPVAAPEPTAEGEESAMDEAGEAAADAIDFEAAQPGEAVIQDRTEVNERGDDGFPGDIAKEGSNYRSSDEDGDAAPVPDQDDTDVLGEDLEGAPTVDSGLPNVEAARESFQESAPDQELTPDNPDE
jgi:cytochrome c